jgi:hypothetical protein
MTYIQIYNYKTDELREYAFEFTVDAEDFASRCEVSEDEEISITDGMIGMDWTDYLCMCH